MRVQPFGAQAQSLKRSCEHMSAAFIHDSTRLASTRGDDDVTGRREGRPAPGVLVCEGHVTSLRGDVRMGNAGPGTSPVEQVTEGVTFPRSGDDDQAAGVQRQWAAIQSTVRSLDV